MPIDDPDPAIDISAAELALGLLEGDERALALRRMLAEPGFARDVEAWRVHFAQLFDLWPDAEAPEDLIERIDTSLGGPAAGGARRARMPWPLLAIASSALAACLLVVVAIRPAPTPAPVVFTQAPVERSGPVLVASLDAKTPIATIYDPAKGAMRIAAPPETPADRVAELWVIGADGVPHTLGVLSRQATAMTVPAADRLRLAAGAVLAISVEPVGGSPTGLPTGPVVAKGALSSV